MRVVASRAVARFAAVSSAVVVASALLTVAAAPSAYAANPNDWDSLTTAFDGISGTGTVQLDSSAGTITTSDGTSMAVQPDAIVTLDLNGVTLNADSSSNPNVPGITVPSNSTLIVEDTHGGGVLNATGGDAVGSATPGAAGIGGGGGSSNGTVIIESGTVTATGGAGGNGHTVAGGGGGGAGIGGGGGIWDLNDDPVDGGSGGIVEIEGGTVHAIGGGGGTASTAKSGGSAAAIGGGGGSGGTAGLLTSSGGGDGAALSISSGASVSVSNDPFAINPTSPIGGGAGAADASPGGFGSLTNAGHLTIGDGYEQDVPSTPGASSVVVNSPGGVIELDTVLRDPNDGPDPGLVQNDGTILPDTDAEVQDALHSALNLLGIVNHGYQIEFNPLAGGGSLPPDQFVYADTFTDAAQTLPPGPTPPAGQIFDGWFTAATGGTKVTGTTSLHDTLGDGPLTATLFAQYVPPPPPPPPPPVSPAPVTSTVTMSSTPNPSTVGQPVTVTASISAANGAFKAAAPAPVSGGTAQLVVDGQNIGTPQPVTGGTVTFPPLTDLEVGSHYIAVVYTPATGSNTPGGSGALTQVVNEAPTSTDTEPMITATLSSAHHKKSGWYRSPVTVTFTCTPGSAPLATPCPKAVTLKASGANRHLTRTVSATDGRTATVTVSGINIDRTGPSVHVRGAKPGGSYAAARRLKCVAADHLSGVATCTIHTGRHRMTNGEVRVSWTATARDNAGNVTKKHGHYVIKA
jgi:hypothetical protein